MAEEKLQVIEAGWKSLEAAGMPADASDIQRSECRKMFYAGAAHLFGSLMVMLDPDAEPTEADLARMDAIDRELKGFFEGIIAGLPKGRRKFGGRHG